MKESSPSSTKTAFCWHDLDDAQRKKVIQKFEEMFGRNFGEEAKWGNPYDTPPVKPGKLLSMKRSFSKAALGFYADNFLDDLFSALTCRDMEIRAEKIVPKTFTEDTKAFWLGFCGSDDCGNYFYDKNDSEKQVAEHNDLFGNFNAAVGHETGMKEVIIPAGTTVYELYRFNDSKWELDKEWPAFKTLDAAQDRATHNLRFIAAFGIQWETWKDAGYNAPESYDLTKETTFKFTKAQLLKGMHLTCHHLDDASYYKDVTKPEVNVDFIEWCKENL